MDPDTEQHVKAAANQLRYKKNKVKFVLEVLVYKRNTLKHDTYFC